MNIKKIAIFVFPHCWAMSVSLVQDTFHIANLLAKQKNIDFQFDVQLLSTDGLDIESASGMRLKVVGKISDIHDFNANSFNANSFDGISLDEIGVDAIILPAFEGQQLKQIGSQHDEVIHLIQNAIQQQIPILAFTTAVYFLAKTELLNHVLMTTHWAFKTELQRQFPEIRLSSNISFLKYEQIYTTGTFHGGISALINLIAEFSNEDFAELCAANLLVADLDQLKPVLYQYRNHQDEAILLIQQFLEEEYVKSLKVSEIAQRFGFSERNLNRRFMQSTTLTVNQYLQSVRVNKATKLLSVSSLSVKEISYAVGYENTSFFIRLFKKSKGVAPSQWRERH